MTPSKSLILKTILALQLLVVSGAFMGAGKSALFNTKVSNHEEDLELTRRIILNHIAQDSNNVRKVINKRSDNPVLAPVTSEISQVEDEAEVQTEAGKIGSSSSYRRSKRTISQEKVRKILSSTTALSSTFVVSSGFLRVIPSLRGKIIRAVKKTSTCAAGANAALSQTASLTLRLTDCGVKYVYGAASAVVDWCVPTSLNLGETSSTYRVTSSSSRRRASGSSGSSSGKPFALPLTFQLENVRTMNRAVREMIFLLQQM